MNKVYHDGEYARRHGDKIEDNPYLGKTKDHFDWMAGWTNMDLQSVKGIFQIEAEYKNSEDKKKCTIGVDFANEPDHWVRFVTKHGTIKEIDRGRGIGNRENMVGNYKNF